VLAASSCPRAVVEFGEGEKSRLASISIGTQAQQSVRPEVVRATFGLKPRFESVTSWAASNVRPAHYYNYSPRPPSSRHTCYVSFPTYKAPKELEHTLPLCLHLHANAGGPPFGPALTLATQLRRLGHNALSTLTTSFHAATLSLPKPRRLPPLAVHRVGPSIRRHTAMASASASSDDVSGSGQQSPLASQRAKEQSRNVRGAYFPLGYKEGFNQWWAGLSPVATEHRVLSFIPFLQQPPTHTKTGSAPASAAASSMDISSDASKKDQLTTSNSITDPYGPRTWFSKLVMLPGKDRALNEFSVERTGEDVENNLVMLHGYGAGLGFFYKNYEALSRTKGWKLYSLDLLGMGRSSRPPFRIHAKDREGKITEAENWFIDALEDWRIERKIERFTLVGHSLGGYMAVAYALKYPGRLNKLILASPVGIPEDPYAVSAEMPDPQDSTMASEFTQDQDATAQADQNNFLNKAPKSAEAPRRPLPKWLTYLWDANISPFSVVRWAGPLGPRLVSGWTSRRFSHLPPDEAQALHDYSYSLFRQRGSGEYALAYILAPGAFARSPLIRRIQGVGRQYLGVHAGPIPDATDAPSSAPDRPRENGLPVVLMYGEQDWMDVAGGYAAEQKLKEGRDAATKGKPYLERKKDQGDAKVVIIQKAGHHVYLDGSEQFNEVMLDEMKDVERRARQASS
jgi:cardiolipin-specific phospholipase